MPEPRFAVESTGPVPDTLVVGVSEYALAGLTAVDYLVADRDADQRGHVAVDGMGTITPFESGTPRRPTRLFAGEDLAMLVSELPVHQSTAGAFASELVRWMTGAGVEEVTMVAGVPLEHGPEEHAPFYVATPDYRERRLTDVAVRPMGGGYLDGLKAELVERAIDTDLQVGVLLTPVHQQAPDLEATLRLRDALADVYDLAIDTAELEAATAEMQRQYAELAKQLAESAEAPPHDRMYM